MTRRILPSKPLKKISKTGNVLIKRKTRGEYLKTQKHADELSADFAQRLPQWWHKKNLGKKPVVVCEKCHAVYYDEHWHTWSTAKKLVDLLLKRQMIKETLCAECANILRGHEGTDGYEGEVMLYGLTDAKEKTEILNLARNVGKRAALRDPEDQIIKIEDRGESARITTTENQLAVSIGKQVARAHKGGKLEIKFSEVDHLVRVVWRRA